MKLEKDLHIVQYDNCKECQYCEFPDEKGEISIPGGILRLSKTIKNESGYDIPNPILARCGVDGRRLKTLMGCKRWFNKTNQIMNLY
jgi:hypothetical protein